MTGESEAWVRLRTLARDDAGLLEEGKQGVVVELRVKPAALAMAAAWKPDDPRVRTEGREVAARFGRERQVVTLAVHDENLLALEPVQDLGDIDAEGVDADQQTCYDGRRGEEEREHLPSKESPP